MKKFLNSVQIRELDAATIDREKITSHRLMERAAHAFVDAVEWNIYEHLPIKIIAGPGNNGGDALAIARILLDMGMTCHIYLCRIGTLLSVDTQLNLSRLQSYESTTVHEILEHQSFDYFSGLVIDGIFGSGLNRPVTGYWAQLIEKINENAAHIISIDIPSGYFSEMHRDDITHIRANHVISFELPKLSFMMPESQSALETFELVEIGLDRTSCEAISPDHYLLEPDDIKSILKAKSKHSHKGSHGKVCIAGGHGGMVGAITLAGQASMVSGCGYVYYLTIYTQWPTIQQIHPEGLILKKSGFGAWTDKAIHKILTAEGMTYGVGCGMGESRQMESALEEFLYKWDEAVVLDADALNILASLKYFTLGVEPVLSKKMKIHPLSILTPHIKEFDRLFGEHHSHAQRITTAKKIAIVHQLYIIIKGAHTAIACPDGRILFNNNGNPGMAVAGSGDVLTGMITSFLAQGYSSEEAAILGVYLHGHAGDLAAESIGEYSMTPQDIITFIPHALNEHLC